MLTPWGFSLSLRLTQCAVWTAKHCNQGKYIALTSSHLSPTPADRFQNMEILYSHNQVASCLSFIYEKHRNIFRWWCKIFSLLSALSVGGNNCSLGVIITVSERCKCCLITTPVSAGLRPTPITTSSSISPLHSSSSQFSQRRRYCV